MRRSHPSLLAFALSSALVACGEKPKTNPFEVKKETVEPPKLVAPPKPEGPPEFTVSAEGPKVGWTYILLDKPEGKQKLKDELSAQSRFVSGKEVPLRVERPSRLAHVAEMLQALFEAGATAVSVTTETRTEFPKTVKFVTAKGATPPACSVSAKVLSERRNAVWSLKGGTAVKSPKGLAGPDQAMTGESLQSAASRCKDSDFVFVSADDDVDWGLTYDLAALTQTVEKAHFSRVVLLYPAPTAGRPVTVN